MEKAEIMDKINTMKNKKTGHEIFYKVRPPEEFGDAVKLFVNSDEKTYRAVVFDPDTLTEFYERTLSDENSACSFISNTLEGKKAETETEQNQDLNQTEYVNIYWDEWRD